MPGAALKGRKYWFYRTFSAGLTLAHFQTFHVWLCPFSGFAVKNQSFDTLSDLAGGREQHERLQPNNNKKINHPSALAQLGRSQKKIVFSPIRLKLVAVERGNAKLLCSLKLLAIEEAAF